MGMANSTLKNVWSGSHVDFMAGTALFKKRCSVYGLGFCMFCLVGAVFWGVCVLSVGTLLAVFGGKALPNNKKFNLPTSA